MNELKHTPGPWVTHCHDDQIYIDTEECSRRPGYEATMVLSFKARGNEANARLIAAAPELLEALIALTEFAKANGYDSNLLPEMKNARAAIAKATTK